MNQKGFAPIFIVIAVVAIFVFAGAGYWYSMNDNKTTQQQIACTEEAKLCSDGSSVGRAGPDCEFAPCPEDKVLPDDGQSNIPQIIGNQWTWMSTGREDGELMISPKKTGAFTLTLAQDGSVNGTTDCNNFFGAYTTDGSKLTFSDFGATMMYCEGSEETIFLEALRQTENFSAKDGTLFLRLQGDSVMTFESSGQAVDDRGLADDRGLIAPDTIQCPDGSFVSRTGPNNEFAECPGSPGARECTCPSGYTKEGDACNPSCYYNTPPCLSPSLPCRSPQEPPISAGCVVENCHGLDIACGPNPAEMCTMMYQLGDRCLGFAKCGMVNGRCQQIENSQFTSCKACAQKCEKDYPNNSEKALDCESRCGE